MQKYNFKTSSVWFIPISFGLDKTRFGLNETKLFQNQYGSSQLNQFSSVTNQIKMFQNQFGSIQIKSNHFKINFVWIDYAYWFKPIQFSPQIMYAILYSFPIPPPTQWLSFYEDVNVIRVMSHLFCSVD